MIRDRILIFYSFVFVWSVAVNVRTITMYSYPLKSSVQHFHLSGLSSFSNRFSEPIPFSFQICNFLNGLVNRSFRLFFVCPSPKSSFTPLTSTISLSFLVHFHLLVSQRKKGLFESSLLYRRQPERHAFLSSSTYLYKAYRVPRRTTSKSS